MNKAIEEKTEGIKDKGQDDAEKNRQQEEQHLSIAAQAYKLFFLERLH